MKEIFEKLKIKASRDFQMDKAQHRHLKIDTPINQTIYQMIEQ